MTVRQGFLFISVVLLLLIATWAAFWPPAAWLFYPVLALVVVGIYDMLQRRHTILRLYPVIGHFRFLFESFRVEIQQYFVESDTDGRPVNREFRSLVYQRAKGVRDTRPFGTIFDVYRDGCEWINHSLAPKEVVDHDPRIVFGDGQCGLSPSHIQQRVGGTVIKNYDEMYPPIPNGCLLDDSVVPERWKAAWSLANTNSW